MAKIDTMVQDVLSQKKIAVVDITDKRETGCNLPITNSRITAIASSQSIHTFLPLKGTRVTQA